MSRRILHLLLALFAYSACFAGDEDLDSDDIGEDVAELAGPPNPNFAYFGFYWGTPKVNDTDLLSTFSNVVYTLPGGPIAQIQARGAGAMVDGLFMFFDINGHSATWKPGAPAFRQWVASMQAQGLTSTVKLIYLDEPTAWGIPTQFVQRMGTLIHQNLPGVKFHVNYQGSKIPASFPHAVDLVSFTEYGGMAAVRSKYQSTKAKLAPHQRMMLIPRAFHYAGKPISQATLVQDARQYLQLCRDPRCAGMIPFLWPSLPGLVGAKDLPAVSAEWQRIGKLVTGK